MLGETVSKNGKRIRLTEERWLHIVAAHRELDRRAGSVMETVSDPDMLLPGRSGELLALKRWESQFLVCVYKETAEDGFIITAFPKTSIDRLIQRGILWKK